MNLDQLRAFCTSLPAVTEGIKWEDHLCFMIGEKMFLITGFEPGATVSLKTSNEDFEELTLRPGIIPAPYMARNKWVQVQDKSVFSSQEWEHYIRQSYELIKSKLPKKLQREIDAAA